MQIYFTDPDPRVCARNLPDALANKILTEIAQLTCSVIYEETGMETPFKPIPQGIEFKQWVKQSQQHWNWLLMYAYHLYRVWSDSYREGRLDTHKSYEAIRWCGNTDLTFSDIKFGDPPNKCIAEYTKTEEYDPNLPAVEFYQKYLNWKVNQWRKRQISFRFYNWSGRPTPKFIEEK